MKARSFFLFSIAYLILVALGIVFFFHELFENETSVHFNILFYERDFSMPSYIWAFAPLCLYVILANIMFFVAFVSHSLKMRKINKDSEKLESFLSDLALCKNSKIHFSSKEFKQAAELITCLYTSKTSVAAKELSAAIIEREKVENEEICELNHLAKDNELFIKNELTKAKKDLEFAKKIIKKYSELSDEISKIAYENIMQNAKYIDIKTLKITKSKKDYLLILERFFAKNIELSNAEFEVLLDSANLSESEYLQVAKTAIKSMDELVLKAIFEKLKNSKESAQRAYLYLLAKLRMFDDLLQIIHSSDAKMDDFELLLFIKDSGKNYNVDELIR